MGIRLADGGAEDIRTATMPMPEQIAIFQPAPNATISGGMVRVEGFGLATFEQTLVVDVIDANGNTLARQPLIVNAPDLGQPGSFSIDLPYTVSESGFGRIQVRDTSPAFGGTTHLTSVMVTLAP